MSKTVYIGRKSSLVGKTAFQLLANLKNFGVGRMLTRQETFAFPEPSYHLVKRVETYMDQELKFGTIWCETVVRGKRLPGIRPLKIGYRPDFRLIPKDEEAEFVGDFVVKDLGEEPNILPRNYPVPPLMNEYLQRHWKITREQSEQQQQQTKNLDSRFTIPFVYQNDKDLREEDSDLFWIENRLQSEDGTEKPNVDFDGKYHFNQQYLKHCNKTS